MDFEEPIDVLTNQDEDNASTPTETAPGTVWDQNNGEKISD